MLPCNKDSGFRAQTFGLRLRFWDFVGHSGLNMKELGDGLKFKKGLKRGPDLEHYPYDSILSHGLNAELLSKRNWGWFWA